MKPLLLPPVEVPDKGEHGEVAAEQLLDRSRIDINQSSDQPAFVNGSEAWWRSENIKLTKPEKALAVCVPEPVLLHSLWPW